MATGNTEFKFNYNGVIKDFYDVFQSSNNNIITNFKTAGNKDLGTLFMSGNSGIVTGYKLSSGQDLGSLFEKLLPFIATNAIETGVVNGATTKYYYAIFTDTSATTKTIAPNPKFNYVETPIQINFICVGGGGGGGGASGGISCGGGGGGGAYRDFASYNISNPLTYNITVGANGTGGPATGNGTAGGESSVKYNSSTVLIRCTGGGAGTNNGAGSGGQVYVGTTLIGQGNGGAGGDQAAGVSCYYNNTGGQTLGIPTELVNANPTCISNYYSGGGGGSKANNEDNDYTGGQGGGTTPVDSPGSNTGLGGARGTRGTAGNGFPGNGYGSGGGSGGNGQSFRGTGGDGRQGIVICYAAF